ncbi:APG12-domain-containing protein [Gymnopus androsaceus JB14]|uniref:Ubiquitin-like protein ATG12 n=1 Tax=Gymnopus androsaceus JB14 TaxID=1447944 RepID=A0A6A4GRX7_9AGAR|nr:APG12-domain-containing protein [Gymnopus androsaceus JB14]
MSRTKIIAAGTLAPASLLTSRRSLLPSPEISETHEEALKSLQTYKKKDADKVIVRFKAVGKAPIMKQNFFKITSSNRFQALIQFLRKELGYKGTEPLHTYINLAFSPAPDDTAANLFKSFQTDNHLIVNYSTTAAWG